MTIQDYTTHLQSIEEYSFSVEEVIKVTGKSEMSVKRELSRLIEKNEIINLRKSFYLILPPRYRALKQIPIRFYIHKLFQYLKTDYYIGMFSSAQFYGASHQQLQSEYIITKPPKQKNIIKNSVSISFFTSTFWNQNSVLQMQGEAGHFNISSPMLTIADLVKYQNKIGGLSRVITVLEELVEVLEIKDVEAFLKWYKNKAVLQRIGFLLDEIKINQEILDLIYGHLYQIKTFPILLNPKGGLKAGAVDNKWKVDVNNLIQSDL